jgi:hypothetical protein
MYKLYKYNAVNILTVGSRELLIRNIFLPVNFQFQSTIDLVAMLT